MDGASASSGERDKNQRKSGTGTARHRHRQENRRQRPFLIRNALRPICTIADLEKVQILLCCCVLCVDRWLWLIERAVIVAMSTQIDIHTSMPQ